MIVEFHAENFGCLKNVTARLTRLHAFIGPNDSGKSTLLRAVATLSHIAAGDSIRGDFRFTAQLPSGTYINIPSLLHPRRSPSDEREIVGVRLLRLDPDSLRQPSGLIPADSRISFDERGGGLPGVFDAIRDHDDVAFEQIKNDVRRLFPTLKTIRPKSISPTQKSIEFELIDGTRFGASQVSEGMLYYLAFSMLRHLDRVALLLVEEPENGLHPSRIADVMRVLREVSKTTQVLIATHSPLVVNELQPDEVTIVTRPSLKEGTRLTPMRETPNFAERSKVYVLGELWLAYADGNLEAPLLTQPTPAP